MILTCQRCSQKNRVGAEHLTATARCGQCKTAIGPVGHPINASPAEFDEVVARATVPVLVDFWAAWCGPCKMVAPEVARTAAGMAGRAVVLKVDTERHPDLAARYNVSSIPHFVVLKGGRVVSQQSGAVPHTELGRWLEEAGA
jgi:thioredoxin 2